MVFPGRRRQRAVAPFPHQRALIPGAMLGGLGSSLVPFHRDKLIAWGSPYAGGSSSRRRNHARFASPFAQAAYGHRFGRQPHIRGYGHSRAPFSRLSNLGGYPGSYAGGYSRRPSSSMYPGYRMGSAAYRNPYMGPGYGVRPRPIYGRSSWNTPLRRPPSMRRGYPPSSRRRETYPTQWYNDTTFSDEEDDDWDDPYEESDCEDTRYGSTYGRQRTYATNYDDSDEDDDDFDDEGYDDEDGYDDDQYDPYSSNLYSSHQYRSGRGDW
ncbi:hypothetical protein K458DRAFT_404372 [Lentithecium fluviatile CBS 122367]|uniref:Uncharacterized protein n=1 Tax=Lentithecium fluviatile CBS 122367 TaxID=1168545 RepID=A0A6G1J1I8_9PLEO|nr:hypothetical protein K458DRAFT_404372 [Lentithecium fluviatile CBS 122367]